MKTIKLILGFFCSYIVRLENFYTKEKRKKYYSKYKIDASLITAKVSIINPHNIEIGCGSYMNSGFLHAGEKSKIIIGENCNIGYNVSIKVRTHNKINPTLRINNINDCFESDIIIGDNVFIREGIIIGNNVTIGANSVVTKSIADNSVVGGGAC